MPEDVMPNTPELDPAPQPDIQPDVQETQPDQQVQQDQDFTQTEQPDIEAAPQGKEPLPADVVKMLKELGQANPDAAPIRRALQDSYYGYKAYREIFQNMDSARSIHAAMEAVGGPDGLVELQTRAEMADELDQLAEAGDPRVMTAMASEFPDGFKKLVPVALEQLQRMDAQAYDAALRQPLIQALEASGLRQNMQRALRMIQGGHAELAQQELAGIAEWLNGLADEAQRDGGQIQHNQSVTQQQSDSGPSPFQAQIIQEGNTWLDSRIQEAVKSFKGLNADQLADLKAGIINALDTELGGNSTYQRQLQALLRSQNADRTLRYIKASAGPYIQRLANSVYSRRYGNQPARQTAPVRPGVQQQSSNVRPGQVGGGPTQPIMVASMPTPDQVDHDKTDMGMLMRHRAYLKDGKYVTWPRNVN